MQGETFTVTLAKTNEKQILKGCGKWNDPHSNLEQFTSALSGVHVGHGVVKSSFSNVCDKCRENWLKDDRTEGCNSHSSAACCQRRKGNATKSPLFEGTKSFLISMCKHTVKGAEQLLPSEVKQLGVHCINSCDKFLVMVYVIILFGIDLFMRKFEIQATNHESFLTDLFVMNGEYLVQSMLVHLKKKITTSQADAGKSDYIFVMPIYWPLRNLLTSSIFMDLNPILIHRPCATRYASCLYTWG